MKLLFVCTVPTEKNGITNVIFNLIRGFDRNDMKIGYVSINEPDDFYKSLLRECGIDLYVIQRLTSHPLNYVKQLAKIACNYDIIHAHGNSATLLLEMLAGKIAKTPVRIAHSHNTSCKAKYIDKLMRPLFYSLCNGRLACGEAAGKWLFGRREFKIINNGIDTEKFHFELSDREKIRQILKIDSEYIIGNIANFVEAKNHDFLIDIFAEVLNSKVHAKLLLLGDGPLQEKIRTKVMDLGIEDKVIFAGSVSNPQQYMSAMDLIVMPSLYEGLPLTLVEEQANGLSAIVSNSVTKQVDVTGRVFFKPLEDDTEDWAKTVLCFLNRLDDRLEISEESISRIKEAGYDVFNVASQLKKYYHDCIQKHKKRS